MAMIRKQIYLTRELDEKVKQLSAAWGVAEAEVIRVALENLSGYRPDARRPQSAVRETATLPYGAGLMDANDENIHRQGRRVLDHQAWEEELAFIMERARTVRGSTVKFNREDVYDKRRIRLSD
jgi:hypothetical protein